MSAVSYNLSQKGAGLFWYPTGYAKRLIWRALPTERSDRGRTRRAVGIGDRIVHFSGAIYFFCDTKRSEVMVLSGLEIDIRQ